MTGLEIFFVGSLLLCNAVIAGVMVFGKAGKQSSRKANEKSDVPDNADEQPEKEATPEQKSCVGASSFDIDRLEAKMIQAVTDTMKETFPILVNGMIGDVRLKDVEFAEGKPDKDETETQEKANSRLCHLLKPMRRLTPTYATLTMPGRQHRQPRERHLTNSKTPSTRLWTMMRHPNSRPRPESGCLKSRTRNCMNVLYRLTTT